MSSKLSAQSSLPFEARAVTWNYPTTVTLELAREQAKMYDENGVNLLICNGRRYLFPIADDPREYNDPFHFELYPTEKSDEATSIVVTAMKERGIKVMHHTTAAYCPKLQMEKHPDWCQENIMNPGKPVFFGEYGGVYMYCLNNPEFRQAYFDKVIKLQERMNFDAWMIDEVEWLPDWFSCGCVHCRSKFKAETGYDLPTDKDASLWGDFTNPVWRAWIAARMRWSGDFFKDLRTQLDAHGMTKDKVLLTACHAGVSDTWSAQYWGIDVVDLTRGIDWVFYEAYVNKGAPFYSWRRYLAEIQAYSALARQRTAHPGFVLFYPHGGNIEKNWCWAANFTLGQRSWLSLPVDGNNWERRHQFLNYPKGKEIVDVALVFSKSSRDFLRKGQPGKQLDALVPTYNQGYIDEWGAWAETLVAGNIPYQIILDEQLLDDNLKEYKAVLLPSTECLSDKQIEALLKYASTGGKIVLSGYAGSKDETGAPRDNRALIEKLEAVASLKIDSDTAESAYRGHVRMDKPVKLPSEDKVQYMKDKLSGVLEDVNRSWSVTAPEGVVVKVWENEKKSRVKVVALNCVGADLKEDTVLTPNYPVHFEHTKVKVNLKKAVVGTPHYAVCYDPSTSSSKVIDIDTDSNGDVSFEFDLVGPLAVVELERSPLPQNIDWLRTQNANWLVLGETLTPEQADKTAKDMLSSGITTLLTDKHRYILYDSDEYDTLTTGSFDNIWQGRPLRQSAEVTRNLVDACHKIGMRVIWHTTYCMVSRDLIERHPEWGQQDLREQGKLAFFKFYGGNWNICLNNPEARNAYFKRVADLTKETGVDGWMIDEVEWLPDWFECGCPVCMKQFTEATGFVMPSDKESPIYGNYENPIWRAWTTWRMTCTGKFFKDLRRYMENEGLGHLAYTCCHAGVADTWSGQVWGIDEFELAKGMNFCFYEAYIKNGAPYYGWKRHLAEMDIYRAISRGRTNDLPVLSLFYPRNPEESKFVTFLTSLVGHRAWITYSNTPTDFSPTAWFAKFDKEFDSNEKQNLANVGLYFSKSTRDLLGKNANQENNVEYVNKFIAWDLTLTENNVPKETLIDDDLLSGQLDRYKYIIIPSAVCLSKACVESLLKWAEKGGKLIVSGDVALRDETGLLRADAKTFDRLKKVAYKVFPEYRKIPHHKANYAIVGKKWLDDRDTVAKKDYEAFLAGIAGDLPWTVDCNGKSVAVRVWDLKDGRIAIHLLNVSGTHLDNGTMVPEDTTGAEIKWQPIESVNVKIMNMNGTESDYSTGLYSLNGNPKVELNKVDRDLNIHVSGLVDYAVVLLKKK